MTTAWQLIDTAPKDGTNLLLYCPTFRRPVWIGHYNVSEHRSNGEVTYRNEGWWIGPFFNREETLPTHWMPLPEAPQ